MKVQFTAQEAANVVAATNLSMAALLGVLCEKDVKWDEGDGTYTVEIDTYTVEIDTDMVCDMVMEQRPMWNAVAAVVTAFDSYSERMKKFDVRKLFKVEVTK